MTYQTLLVEQHDIALYVTLNRPHCRNAMSLTMVEELAQLFHELEHNQNIRALVLKGSEGHFCAGGDIKDMANARGRALQTQSSPEQKENTNPFFELNRAFGRMITQADHLPQVVVTVLEGAVLGGGFGLACVSDVAIACASAQFGLPETGLGVIPAQIAPFVVKRIGLTQARRIALLGDRFDGTEAVKLGIAHYLCNNTQQLDEQLTRVLSKIKRCAPGANRVTKSLLHQVGSAEMEALLDQAAQQFAEAVQSSEGSEGTMAFIQKRVPEWAQ
ncbi:enoyl-CoA hydratase/isomerase family protein [Ketobacter sp.]